MDMAGCTEYIWRSYHENLHSFILSRVGDVATADDILQDVFVRIHTGIDTLEDCGKLQSWIYQITRNAIIDHYRNKKKTIELPETLEEGEEELINRAREDIDECLMPMVESLPEPYREAVLMSEIEGKTQKEVAEMQGITLSGAKSRVQRGRGMIKEMMLGCCDFEFDHMGNVMDYERKDNCDCGGG
jgi:RNA polymerase sigma-70 factor (ECF subfamily)